MARNPILEEIYAARDMLLAEYNGDVHAYVLDARERAPASGRPIAMPKQPPKGVAGAVVGGVSAAEAHSSSEDPRFR
jgi:hypothetical protein